MAHAASIHFDLRGGTVQINSSIVGLPPIFLYQRAGFVVLTSEQHLLRAFAGERPELDPQAVVELFQVGYPLAHRTLFRDLTLMPGGNTLAIDATGAMSLVRCWALPEDAPWEDWPSYLEHQAEVFKQAVRRLQLSDSFFSLTGGLDTRAILTVLVESGITVPAVTMSGSRSLCLDARLAGALCASYGLPHTVVRLDGRFLEDLPRYVVEAARLTGGLASVEQAHEVFFFRQSPRTATRRLCGNLGNQVGRGGVEGPSMRNADLTILSKDLRAGASAIGPGHWLTGSDRGSRRVLYQSLLQHEFPFSSVGNFTVGHHFCIQQSPYANRMVIEAVSRVHRWSPPSSEPSSRFELAFAISATGSSVGRSGARFRGRSSPETAGSSRRVPSTGVGERREGFRCPVWDSACWRWRTRRRPARAPLPR